MTTSAVQDNIRNALKAIVAGKIVKRAGHDLIHVKGDFTHPFLEELERVVYGSKTADQAKYQPGERVIAFYIKGSVEYSGWVFWEQFTS